MRVELLILVDDSRGAEALRAEHGLSLLLSGPRRRVLFDAAASSDTLLANAGALGVDLGCLDAVVISHGHYDHTGGLLAVVQRNCGLEVHAHPGAFRHRWANPPGKPLREISCPHSIERLCQAGAVFHSVAHAERLETWLVVSGPIGGPRYGPDVFVVREAGEMVADGFEDEVCLLVRGRRGWAVLTGCCHRGLKNTLRKARSLVRGEPLTALIGGLHLGQAGPGDLAEILRLLRRYGVRNVYPCHCTGAAAIDYLEGALPGQVHRVAAGSQILL